MDWRTSDLVEKKRGLEVRINQAVAEVYALTDELQNMQRKKHEMEREIDSLKSQLLSVNNLLGST
jgi:chromosome segregation ATPase